MKKMITKESGHWYCGKTGEPRYRTVGKNGKERNTTLRDARTEGYVPSVTTVLGIMAKPGLERWKQEQLLLAAATLPREEGESIDDWCKRVVIDAGEHGKSAADKGTAIHGAIERFFLGKPVKEYGKEVDAVVALLDELGIKHISTEKSFAKDGYGGKVDFEGVDANGNHVIIDFKTQDFKGQKKHQYPEMVCQLAAYANGLGKPSAKLINIFISRNLDTPEVAYHEWSHDESFIGLCKFKLILDLWQLEKNYYPKLGAE